MIDWVRSNKNLVIGVVIGMAVLVVGIVLFMQSNLFDRDAQVAEDIERYISEDGDITITSDLPEDDIIEVPEVIEDMMSFTKEELLAYEESDIDFNDETEALRKVTAAYWNWHHFHEERYEGASDEVIQKMMNGRIDIYNYIVANDVVKQVEEDHLMAQSAFDSEFDSWIYSHSELRLVDFGDHYIYGLELYPNGEYRGKDLLYHTRSHTDIGELTVEGVFIETGYGSDDALVHVNMTTNDGSFVSFKDLLDAGIEMRLNNHTLVDPSGFYRYPDVFYEIVTSESPWEVEEEELKHTAVFSGHYPQVMQIYTESDALPSIIGFDENLLSQFKEDLESFNVEGSYWQNILKINRTVDDTIRNFSIWEDDLEGQTVDAFAQMIYEYNEQLPEALTLTISYNGETVDINVPNNNNQ